MSDYLEASSCTTKRGTVHFNGEPVETTRRWENAIIELAEAELEMLRAHFKDDLYCLYFLCIEIGDLGLVDHIHIHSGSEEKFEDEPESVADFVCLSFPEERLDA